MTTGEKIAFARRSKGLTQEGLAERLGVTRQAVSKWESDRALPDTDKLLRICDELGIGCEELLRPGAPLEPRPVTEDAPREEKDGKAPPSVRLTGGAKVFLVLLFVVGGLLVAFAALLFFGFPDRIDELIVPSAVCFFIGIGALLLAVIVKLFLQKK